MENGEPTGSHLMRYMMKIVLYPRSLMNIYHCLLVIYRCLSVMIFYVVEHVGGNLEVRFAEEMQVRRKLLLMKIYNGEVAVTYLHR